MEMLVETLKHFSVMTDFMSMEKTVGISLLPLLEKCFFHFSSKLKK